MNSIILLVIELILCLFTLGFLYLKYKQLGLYGYIVIISLLFCTLSLKTITIFDYDLNLGIIPFTTLFIASDIIIQKKGPNEIKKIILILISSLLLSYGIIYLSVYLNSSQINLFTNASYNNIYTKNLRLIFASFVTTIYSLLLNSKLYYSLKRLKNNIFISASFTTIITQFISSLLFALFAYTFEKEVLDIIKIIMIRYLVSIVAGLLGITIIYLANNVKEKN